MKILEISNCFQCKFLGAAIDGDPYCHYNGDNDIRILENVVMTSVSEWCPLEDAPRHR